VPTFRALQQFDDTQYIQRQPLVGFTRLPEVKRRTRHAPIQLDLPYLALLRNTMASAKAPILALVFE
jgi:hypothetical protein